MNYLITLNKYFVGHFYSKIKTLLYTLSRFFMYRPHMAQWGLWVGWGGGGELSSFNLLSLSNHWLELFYILF